MENYRKREKKNHIFIKIFGMLMLIFLVATSSIVLYDLYENIEIEDEYSASKISKEISVAENEKDISKILKEVSKSVVRNIKNRYK